MSDTLEYKIPEIIYIDKIHFNTKGCTPMIQNWSTHHFSYHEIEYILKSSYDELVKLHLERVQFFGEASDIAANNILQLHYENKELQKKVEELEKELKAKNGCGINLDLAKLSEQLDEALKNTPKEYFEEIQRSVEQEREGLQGWVKTAKEGWVIGVLQMPVKVDILSYDWGNSKVTIKTNYQLGEIDMRNIYDSEETANKYSR